MTDPNRILDGTATSEVDSLSRDLLTSLSPTAEEQERLLGRVLSHVGVAAAAGAAATTVSTEAGASGTATAAIAVKSSFAKWLLPLLATVPLGAGLGYMTLGESSEAPPSLEDKTPITVGPAHSEPPAVLPAEETAPTAPIEEVTAPPPAEPTTHPARTSGTLSKESALREEDRLVRKAREYWKTRQHEAALATLSELSRRFPDGVLLREREMLRTSILKDLDSAGSSSRSENGSK